jgi:hypothetical protein
MVNSYTLLAALQRFLERRGVRVEGLTVEPMVLAMLDWYRSAPIETLGEPPLADVLVYRYGGWSEGCATGFKLSLMRRVTVRSDGGETDWYAGVTLMFDPARYAEARPLSTVSADWPTLDAFLHAIESSPAYRASVAVTPMGAMLESGGLR